MVSIISLRRWPNQGKHTEKGRPTSYSRPDSKTIVADHQQLKSAICAAAFSSTPANLIVR
jgi:hypothetical protein